MIKVRPGKWQHGVVTNGSACLAGPPFPLRPLHAAAAACANIILAPPPVAARPLHITSYSIPYVRTVADHYYVCYAIAHVRTLSSSHDMLYSYNIHEATYPFVFVTKITSEIIIYYF